MRADEFICFMYHELEVPGRTTCRSNAGYMRYVVKTSSFAQQLTALREHGCRGCNVTEAIQGRQRAIALTFDDCTSSDVEVAGPMLLQAGFGATFYAVASWVNGAGHLTQRDLRRLVEMGFELGSHSLTHPFFPRMSYADIRRELAESKDRLEQAASVPVRHFSCPYGGCGHALLDTAMEVGYKSVATSRVGLNRPGSFVLNRVAVHRRMRLGTFRRMCEGEGLITPLLRQTILAPFRRTAVFLGY